MFTNLPQTRRDGNIGYKNSSVDFLPLQHQSTTFIFHSDRRAGNRQWSFRLEGAVDLAGHGAIRRVVDLDGQESFAGDITQE
jgi:hypothetical protein